MTTCGCQNTCSCGAQGVTVQVPNPIVITVVPPTAAQSTQSTVVVKPGQGGSRGPQGIQGLQGAQGTNREIAYRYNQGVASSTWTIAHNLNFYPNVTTMDSTGAICEGEIVYTNPNNLTVTFLAAFSGVAYLS